MLTLLGHPFEGIEIDLANKPADFVALSPTGAVPMLEDGGFVLYESAVINEYLAETLKWVDGFATDAKQRARERLAMKRFDDVVIPTAFESFKNPAVLTTKPLWRREIDQLATTVKHSKVQSLLGLHMATHWLRITWAFPHHEVVSKLGEACGSYLDAAAGLPCVVSTSPEREATANAMRTRFGPV
jgi:glutathione S-transferase